MKLFGKVAVASTFSPRFLPMLAEAKAFATLLGEPFEIIHAGDETAEDRDRFASAFAEMEIASPIHWRQALEKCLDQAGSFHMARRSHKTALLK